MQIKEVPLWDVTLLFRCRSIWKNLASDRFLPVRGEITFMRKFHLTGKHSQWERNYPSMEMNFFSGSTGFASFFGMKSFKIPCLNSALISSSVTSSPT